jgi:hypothetical protein
MQAKGTTDTYCLLKGRGTIGRYSIWGVVEVEEGRKKVEPGQTIGLDWHIERLSRPPGAVQ